METDKLRRGLSAIATEVEPVDLRDRVLAESQRIRTRRSIGLAALAATVVVAAVALPIALRDGNTHVPMGVTPEPTILPTEVTDNAPDLGPFDDLTITVPSWGGSNSAGCPTGTVRVRHGFYEGARPVNVLSYVAVDVDHDGAEDYVAQLMCSEGPENGGSQVVAYRRDGTPIGRVVGTQDGFAMMDYLQARPGGRVAVLVSKEYTDSGQDTVPNQWRTYAWQGNRFEQVDGPTTFPANPPAAILSVESTSLSFQNDVGRMTVTVRNTGTVDVARVQVLLVLPNDLQPAGHGWAGCARRPDPGSTTLVCIVEGLRAHSAIPLDLTVIASGRPVGQSIGQGEHYASIWHLPPFDGLVTYQQQDTTISLPSR